MSVDDSEDDGEVIELIINKRDRSHLAVQSDPANQHLVSETNDDSKKAKSRFTNADDHINGTLNQIATTMNENIGVSIEVQNSVDSIPEKKKGMGFQFLL